MPEIIEVLERYIIIVELMSPSTAQEDLGSKRVLYARTFRTPDYFCYDRDEDRLWGWHLADLEYTLLAPNEAGRLWSNELEAWIGRWEGVYLGERAIWLRFYDRNGHLIPTEAEAEHQRAEAERLRAESAEAELARLKAELASDQQSPNPSIP